jgi:hypothetical protein
MSGAGGRCTSVGLRVLSDIETEAASAALGYTLPMKRCLILAIASIALLAACGDDDDGPAADVGGVWNGQMESTNPAAPGGSYLGTVCLEFEQAGRDIEGRAVFQTLGEHRIGGAVANTSISFVWSSSVTPTEPAAPLSFASGGTVNGEVTDAGMSGTWTSISGDNGNWTAVRGTAESCG